MKPLSFDLHGTLNSAAGAIPVHWQKRIAPGSAVVLSGESGSGKTSLLRALCGLPAQVRGRVARGEQLWQTAGKILLPIQQRPVGMMCGSNTVWKEQSYMPLLMFCPAVFPAASSSFWLWPASCAPAGPAPP